MAGRGESSCPKVPSLGRPLRLVISVSGGVSVSGGTRGSPEAPPGRVGVRDRSTRTLESFLVCRAPRPSTTMTDAHGREGFSVRVEKDPRYGGQVSLSPTTNRFLSPVPVPGSVSGHEDRFSEGTTPGSGRWGSSRRTGPRSFRPRPDVSRALRRRQPARAAPTQSCFRESNDPMGSTLPPSLSAVTWRGGWRPVGTGLWEVRS